jgi:hypothetical protein
MLATSPSPRSLSMVPEPDADRVVHAGPMARVNALQTELADAGQHQRPATGHLDMGQLHATVIQTGCGAHDFQTLCVDQQKNESPRLQKKGASECDGTAGDNATSKGPRRTSIEVSVDDSSSNVSTPGSSESTCDSESRSASMTAAWTVRPSAPTRKCEETCLHLVAQHEQDTHFGSLPQTLRNVLSAQPVYDLAFMLPIGLGKLTGHPELILFAGFLIEFVALPLTIHSRLGNAGSEAFEQYNFMVKLLGGRLRDIASGKTHPLDEHGNSTDPFEKFGARKLLDSWLMKLAHDDALLLGFGLAYSAKNVIPTLLHDYHFYDHKTMTGTAADVGLHAASGMTWATTMTLLSQGMRHWAYPEKYRRSQSVAVLDADIARLNAQASDLKREIRQSERQTRALASTAPSSDMESGAEAAHAQPAIHQAARALLTETMTARKQAQQARQDATFQSKLAKDYRAIWCGEKRKPAIASAVGIGIMMVPLVVTALHEIQKLASPSTTSNITHVASFEDHLESDLLVPGVLGAALALGGTMGSIVYLLMEGMLGLADRCRGQNDAVAGVSNSAVADQNGTSSDAIGAPFADDDSVITVSSDDADGDSDSASEREYESASES